MSQKNKRNAQGNGTIYKRADGRWEAKYSVGVNTATGKLIRRSIYGATQKAVREQMRAILAEIDANTYSEPSKMKLSTWLQEWLTEHAVDKKYGTIKGYKAQVRTNIEPFIGDIRLNELTTSTIKHLYNMLSRGTETKKALSPKSVKNVHGILHEALSVATALGFLKTNPADNKIVLKLPKGIKKEIKPLTDAQVASFLKEVELDEYSAYFKTVLFSGMRESEAIGLTWDCVDFTTGTIVINKQLQKRPIADGGYVFVPLKNSKTRTVGIAPFAVDFLKAHWVEQAKMKLRAGPLWEGWENEKERQTSLVLLTRLDAI